LNEEPLKAEGIMKIIELDLKPLSEIDDLDYPEAEAEKKLPIYQK